MLGMMEEKMNIISHYSQCFTQDSNKTSQKFCCLSQHFDEIDENLCWLHGYLVFTASLLRDIKLVLVQNTINLRNSK
jgi:hypothetical protein